MRECDKVAFKAKQKEKLNKINPKSYLNFESTFKELLVNMPLQKRNHLELIISYMLKVYKKLL